MVTESVINEHESDAPVTNAVMADYPGFDYIGSRGGVVYLQNPNGVYCIKAGRLIQMGRKFSLELLKQLT